MRELPLRLPHALPTIRVGLVQVLLSSVAVAVTLLLVELLLRRAVAVLLLRVDIVATRAGHVVQCFRGCPVALDRLRGLRGAGLVEEVVAVAVIAILFAVDRRRCGIALRLLLRVLWLWW